MTKRKRSLRNAKKKSKSTSASKAQQQQPVTNGEVPSIVMIEKLLSEAECAVNTFNYEEASAACRNVLELDSSNLKAIEMLAGITIENDNILEAQSMLLHCVELCPEDGHTKYFSLGQLSIGKQSVDFYLKGIEILNKKLNSPQKTLSSSENSQELPISRVISDAYCSIVEIYMTDLCDEEDAENECHKTIESAIQADESNPEAHQCLANFHLVKGEFEESRCAINKVLSLWLPQYRAIWEGEVAAADDSTFQPPSYDSRINTSKMLIELDMFDEASEVLEGLVAEDDEVVETWYLLGWSHFLRGEDYKKNAAYYFQKAKEVYKKIRVAFKDQMVHIDELLEEIGDVGDLEDSDSNQGNFPSDSEASDDENCDVEMKQDNV